MRDTTPARWSPRLRACWWPPAGGAAPASRRPATAPLRRLAGHPQLRRARRHRRARLRHRRRLPVRAAYPHLRGAAGQRAREHQGHRRACRTGRLYISTPLRVAAFDLATDTLVWNRQYPGGADRLAVSPDGRLLYVPSFEGPHWHAVDAATGDIVAKVVTESGAHNTIYGPAGRQVYLAGLKSPMLNVADPATHTVSRRWGRSATSIRPFTINAAADARLRQRQRPARLRSRRPHDRQGAAPRRGDRDTRRAR